MNEHIADMVDSRFGLHLHLFMNFFYFSSQFQLFLFFFCIIVEQLTCA